MWQWYRKSPAACWQPPAPHSCSRLNDSSGLMVWESSRIDVAFWTGTFDKPPAMSVSSASGFIRQRVAPPCKWCTCYCSNTTWANRVLVGSPR